jgi:hypothetical protein
MKYTIVFGNDMLDLTTKVNEHINEGWKPQGGVCMDNYRCYYQAMILEL